ncbi:acyl-CoA dehydrogenase family protein [Nocardioides alcanivorans]|uniref:acyl-CoA dehydrogenase family protein n=1 Tax=Nocardioides alcanivorans TaxID=2897352 RepID=UPI001F45D13C|nr:acyl-CoA dehydrogenase family protein [Nocardioides alcanivorans]
MSDLYGTEHEDFRTSVRTFFEREVAPRHGEWEEAGLVPREVWRKAGAAGLLCFDVPTTYGGAGIDDFRFNMVLTEVQTRLGLTGPGFTLHTDVVVPYLTGLGNDEQKRRWLPGCVTGDLITAIAMTEPEAGSDLRGIRTTARPTTDEHGAPAYLLNGTKTFISNGVSADLVIVVARTGDARGDLSLLVVERSMPGFEVGRRLEKVGLWAQDTAELSFSDVVVPAANLLGVEGHAFGYLMRNLRQERLAIGAQAVSACESLLEMCLAHAREREAFGRTLGSFQHNRFLLAEMATETRVARAFLDDCARRHLRGELAAEEAAMVKWWPTELQNRMAARALQLHGGAGYMRDHPVARAFLDGRITTIYGGTTEVQKEVIGRALGL